MPETDGLDLIPRLRATRPTSKIIAMSGGSMGVGLSRLGEAARGERHAQRSRSVSRELLDLVSSQLN